MATALAESIDHWIDEGIPSLSIARPATVHIDELLGRTLLPAEYIAHSIGAFTVLVQRVIQRKLPAQPTLVIPLVSRGVQVYGFVPHTMSDVILELDHHEPPSLYLLHWDLWRTKPTYEQYQCPILLEFPGLNMRGLAAYYKEFRDALAIAKGWDFARSIQFQYFPDTL